MNRCACDKVTPIFDFRNELIYGKEKDHEDPFGDSTLR